MTRTSPANHPLYDQALVAALAEAAGPECPTRLAEALDYAVFPGGARVRPQLCLAVALANHCDVPELAGAAAASIELLHCASLVHDDLPCFDDADERRGKPSVHACFGESIAVLTGDALIVAAFRCLGMQARCALAMTRLPALLAIVSESVGAPRGICAGQAWEGEPQIDLERYHAAKTGALFTAATRAGAAAAGADPAPWAALGACIGRSYQIADDILDVAADAESIGKPVGQDLSHNRPSMVREHGLDGAIALLKATVEESLDVIPECPGRAELRELVRHQSRRFLPKNLAVRAA